MNKAILIISFLGLFFSQSCSNRTDKVFSAFDELHYLILYEKGNEFELLYNGLNTATGTYLLKNDTIQLTYNKNQFNELDPNEKLTRLILIDKENRRVKSLDDKRQFCAKIDMDKRKI